MRRILFLIVGAGDCRNIKTYTRDCVARYGWLGQAAERIWRRGQDSNLQALSGGGFQDRCTTNYATPPNWLLNHSVRGLGYSTRRAGTLILAVGDAQPLQLTLAIPCSSVRYEYMHRRNSQLTPQNSLQVVHFFKEKLVFN